MDVGEHIEELKLSIRWGVEGAAEPNCREANIKSIRPSMLKEYKSVGKVLKIKR